MEEDRNKAGLTGDMEVSEMDANVGCFQNPKQTLSCSLVMQKFRSGTKKSWKISVLKITCYVWY